MALQMVHEERKFIQHVLSALKDTRNAIWCVIMSVNKTLFVCKKTPEGNLNSTYSQTNLQLIKNDTHSET